MDKNTEQKTDKRLANLRPPWKPGVCPNPKGKPRGSVDLTKRLKKALATIIAEDGTQEADRLVQGGIRSAMKGNAAWAKLIFERVDGPLPTIHEGGDPAKPVKIIVEYADNPVTTEPEVTQ